MREVRITIAQIDAWREEGISVDDIEDIVADWFDAAGISRLHRVTCRRVPIGDRWDVIFSQPEDLRSVPLEVDWSPSDAAVN